MKIGEKITLRNLGECKVLANKNNETLIEKDNVVYFATNLNKKRQDEEYSYDTVVCYGFTLNESYQLIQPMYADIINNINKQYKISDKLSKMLIEALMGMGVI